jgi:hypothetical protein
MPERAMSQGVATRETYAPSRRMQSAAAAERARIERELTRLDSRRATLAQELAAVDEAQEELHDQLRVLNRFTHEFGDDATPRQPPRLSVVPARTNGSRISEATVLRGARIRETAVRVLAGTPEAHGPVHYRTWFELFTRSGFMTAGKDPLATFLTQVGRSPVVERTSGAGAYQLDFSFPRRARARMAELRSALERAQALASDAGVEDIAAAREKRAELTAELAATERALEEALRSLGDTEP